MVDFNDRRLTEAQKNPAYVRPDIKRAVEQHLAQGSDRRVTLSFNDPNPRTDGVAGGAPRIERTGYLRADEQGNPALYANARSTRGQSLPLEHLASIESSKRDKPYVNDETGKREGKVRTSYWARWSGPYSLPN